MSPRVKGVLAGGALSGIVGAIIGLIPILGYACCLVALVGGALAGLLHVKSSEEGVSMGGTAVTGAVSGLVMFVLMLIIYIPIHILIQAIFTLGSFEILIDMWRYSWPQLIVGYIIQLVLAIVYCFGFSTAGGVLANVIFEDRKPGSADRKKDSGGPVAMPGGQQSPAMGPGQGTPMTPQTPQTPQQTPQQTPPQQPPPQNPGQPPTV